MESTRRRAGDVGPGSDHDEVHALHPPVAVADLVSLTTAVVVGVPLDRFEHLLAGLEDDPGMRPVGLGEAVEEERAGRDAGGIGRLRARKEGAALPGAGGQGVAADLARRAPEMPAGLPADEVA